MKKRFLALTLALAMTMGMATTAFAASTDTTINQESKPQTDDVEVKYNVTGKYEVTIPADVELTADGDYSKDFEVSAKDVLVESGKSLQVKMSSANYSKGTENGYKLMNEKQDSSIKYSIKKDNADFANEAMVLEVKPNTDLSAGAATGSTTLTFSTSEENVKKANSAGDHTDTLTFAVSVDTATE
jgi:carbonic anhydrase